MRQKSNRNEKKNFPSRVIPSSSISPNLPIYLCTKKPGEWRSQLKDENEKKNKKKQ